MVCGSPHTLYKAAVMNQVTYDTLNVESSGSEHQSTGGPITRAPEHQESNNISLADLLFS